MKAEIIGSVPVRMMDIPEAMNSVPFPEALPKIIFQASTEPVAYSRTQLSFRDLKSGKTNTPSNCIRRKPLLIKFDSAYDFP